MTESPDIYAPIRWRFRGNYGERLHYVVDAPGLEPGTACFGTTPCDGWRTQYFIGCFRPIHRRRAHDRCRICCRKLGIPPGRGVPVREGDA